MILNEHHFYIIFFIGIRLLDCISMMIMMMHDSVALWLFSSAYECVFF